MKEVHDGIRRPENRGPRAGQRKTCHAGSASDPPKVTTLTLASHIRGGDEETGRGLITYLVWIWCDSNIQMMCMDVPCHDCNPLYCFPFEEAAVQHPQNQNLLRGRQWNDSGNGATAEHFLSDCWGTGMEPNGGLHPLIDPQHEAPFEGH